MALVAVPAGMLIAGQLSPVDLYDERGRLLCKAWNLPASELVSGRHNWSALFTTESQLEGYNKRLIHKANLVINKPQATVRDLLDLRVDEPIRTDNGSRYRKPAERHFEFLSAHLEAIRTICKRLSASAVSEHVFELREELDLLNQDLFEIPAASLIFAGREVNLAATAIDRSASACLYMLACIKWIATQPDLAPAIKPLVHEVSVVIFCLVTQLQAPSGSPAHSADVLLGDFRGVLEVIATQHATQAPSHGPDSGPISQLIGATSLAVMRLGINRLSNVFSAVATDRLSTLQKSVNNNTHDHMVRELRRLELLDSPAYHLPGDYVELNNGEIALIADLDEATGKFYVIRLIGVSGLPLGAPMLGSLDKPAHQIKKAVNPKQVRHVFDPCLVLDQFFKTRA